MTNSPRASRYLAALAVLLLALAALAVALAWHTTGDLDLLLHDRVGRAILAGEPVPDTNRFSFTAPDHRWVDHEWAFQVLVALAGDLAGGQAPSQRVAGWQALRLLLTGLLVLVLIREVPWRSAALPGALALAGPVALLALGLLWTRLTLRPELLSFVLLVLVLRRSEAALAAGAPAGWRPLTAALLDPRRPGGQAFLLTLLWYQCHGFAALSVVVWLLGGLLGRRPDSWRRHLRLAGGGAALALVAGLATPAGLDGLLYPLRALGQFQEPGVDLQRTISELVPVLATRGSLALTVPLFQASLAWGLLWTVLLWPRIDRVRLVLWVLAAVAAWQGQRHLGFLAVTLILLHGHLGPASVVTPAQRLAGRLAGPWRLRLVTAASLILPALSLVVAAWWLSVLPGDGFYLREGVARRWGGGLTPAVYPVEAARHVRSLAAPRIANNVDAASTLIALDAGPVAIDGRTEAYPAATWRQYAALRRGGAPAIAQLRQWDAGTVVLAHRNAATQPLLRTLFADPDWTLVFADDTGVVLQTATDRRPGPRGADRLASAAMALERRIDQSPAGRRPDLADRAASLASLLQLAELPGPARRLLTVGLARCPDHPVVLHNLGNALLADGDLHGALRRFEAAARANPAAAPPLVNAGTCLFRLGRFEEAAAAFAGATRRDDRNFQAWANLAEARRQLGDRDGAAAAYERAIELAPEDRRLRSRSRTL